MRCILLFIYICIFSISLYSQKDTRENLGKIITKDGFNSILLNNLYKNKKNPNIMINEQKFNERIDTFYNIQKIFSDSIKLNSEIHKISLYDRNPIVILESDPVESEVVISYKNNVINNVITTSFYQPAKEGNYEFKFTKDGYQDTIIKQNLKYGKTIKIIGKLNKKK